jgi:Chaperone of endosialidase
MNSLTQFKKISILPFLIALMLVALAQNTQAVSPPPDGGYPGDNTAEGTNALFSLTTGVDNTALGFQALYHNTTGYSNTAEGFHALFTNTGGAQNTATGVNALLFNTNGNSNTANGVGALRYNTTGNNNTANGVQALFSNTIGIHNTATGVQALFSNSFGAANTAMGFQALNNNTIGNSNTVIGQNALSNNTAGSFNTAIGISAGSSITGDGNVCIGDEVPGAAMVNGTTWISNVYSSVASGRAVYVNSDNKIGTLASTRRVKKDIKPMDKASEAVLALKPVSFRYKKEIDASGTPQFGLVAEEVADINADLVTRDSEGKPETVRYDAVNAMLLNEFLKEHKAFLKEQRKVEEQGAMIARQQKQIEALTEGLQKVSTQLEASKPAPQVVVDNQ